MRQIEYLRTLSTELYGSPPPKQNSDVIQVHDDPQEVAAIDQQRLAEIPKFDEGYLAKFSFEGRLEQVEQDPGRIKDQSWDLRVHFTEQSKQSERLHRLVAEHLLHAELGDRFAVMASELKIASCYSLMIERLQRILATEPFESSVVRSAAKQLELTLSIATDQTLTNVTVTLLDRLRDMKEVDQERDQICRHLNTLQLAGNVVPDWAMDELVKFSRKYNFQIETHYQPTFEELCQAATIWNAPGDLPTNMMEHSFRMMTAMVERDHRRGVEKLAGWIDGHRPTACAAIVLGITLRGTEHDVASKLNDQLEAGQGFWTASQEQAMAEAVAAINPQLTRSAWSRCTQRGGWTLRRKWALEDLSMADMLEFLQQNHIAMGMTLETVQQAFVDRTTPYGWHHGKFIHVSPSPFDLIMQTIWDRINVPDPSSFYHGNYEFAWKGACALTGSELKLEWVASKNDPNNTHEHEDPQRATVRAKIQGRIYEKLFVSHPDDPGEGHVYPPFWFVEDLNAIAKDLGAAERFYLILADGRDMVFNPFAESDNIYLACLPPAVAEGLSRRFGFPILGL